MSTDFERERINSFLERPLLARLATTNPVNLQPHVTPVWFAWDGESLWWSGFKSTRKFRELQRNPRCAVVIDMTENELDNFGVLLEGQAELIEEPRQLVYEKTTWIYTRYLGPDGVLAADPQSWIYDPENLVARLSPERTYSWFPAEK